MPKYILLLLSLSLIVGVLSGCAENERFVRYIDVEQQEYYGKWTPFGEEKKSPEDGFEISTASGSFDKVEVGASLSASLGKILEAELGVSWSSETITVDGFNLPVDNGHWLQGYVRFVYVDFDIIEIEYNNARHDKEVSRKRIPGKMRKQYEYGYVIRDSNREIIKCKGEDLASHVMGVVPTQIPEHEEDFRLPELDQTNIRIPGVAQVDIPPFEQHETTTSAQWQEDASPPVVEDHTNSSTPTITSFDFEQDFGGRTMWGMCPVCGVNHDAMILRQCSWLTTSMDDTVIATYNGTPIRPVIREKLIAHYQSGYPELNTQTPYYRLINRFEKDSISTNFSHPYEFALTEPGYVLVFVVDGKPEDVTVKISPADENGSFYGFHGRRQYAGIVLPVVVYLTSGDVSINISPAAFGYSAIPYAVDVFFVPLQ